MSNWQDIFEKLDNYRFKLPKTFKPGMRTDGLIYADEAMIDHIFKENAHIQVANVACLPGIVGNSLAMPDIHFGYGFPIGGVAAFDPDNEGIISPGGVGYDINCGVRVLRTDLERKDIEPKLKDIVAALATNVPSGVGSESDLSLSKKDLDKLLVEGSAWAVKHGYGTGDDIEHTEARGALPGADPSLVSSRAKERGTSQQGTLGSGNHFLEVQYIEEIYDEKIAAAWGLFVGQVTIMVHSGSRGFGHQVCTDYIQVMQKAAQKYGIKLPDRQLCCAPVSSPEGKDYFGAMAAAANYAWCNRQMLMHWTCETFAQVVGGSRSKLGINLVYDVAHNIAKMEKHRVKDQDREKDKVLCVHRKGATRAFPAGHPELSADYKATGQPVLIPGDMGRYSYLLVGTDLAMKETWGSVCHGAGRMMSRSEATRTYRAGQLVADLEKKGIYVRSTSKKGLVEEAPGAYKDVREVVGVVHNSGLARKIAKMRPMCVVKG
ncbi:MAG: RtcB family protein [Candidatus Margulisbacteria bacterium]|nr:RtcB family protein [Candidatus Margulisiibacteriota bacterium]